MKSAGNLGLGMGDRLCFCVVVESVPNTYHGGGGITAYSAIMALRNEGHTVHVLSLSNVGSNLGVSGVADDIQKLLNLGVDVHVADNVLPHKRRILSTLIPSLSDIFQGARQQGWVFDQIRRIKPDGVLAYHWNAVAAVQLVVSVPRLALVGDPIDLPWRFRMYFLQRMSTVGFSPAFFRSWVASKMRVPLMRRQMNRLLNSCTASGAFAAHHALEFRDRGVKSCNYFRTPTPDPRSDGLVIAKERKFKILHIGHLQGIATLSGVELLVREVIPLLDLSVGAENYEIHLVGGFYDHIPERLKRLLAHSRVIVRGHLNPPDIEFLSSHVVIVPTPIPLGIRVRIITAFSFGACVVAHTANKLGIPELDDNVNCLLGSDAVELAASCSRVFKENSLRERLEVEARKTYEKYFSMEVAGKAISNTLVSLTRSNN